MSRVEILLAKPEIPVTEPGKREEPDVSYPIPVREPTPSTVTPIITPREPVPVGR